MLNAAVELKRHLRNLDRVGPRQYQGTLKILLTFLSESPLYRSLIDTMRAGAGQFDADAWVEGIFEARRGHYELPDEESARMTVLLRLMQQLAEDTKPEGFGAYHLAMGANPPDAVRAVTHHIVAPLVDFLLAQLGTESETLHVLRRFQRYVEWFHRDRLFEECDGEDGRGEKAYDDALREFLFSEGVDYPYSQPHSASGIADVLAGAETDDPLICEVKLFRGTKSRLAQGFTQAENYARDYGKPVGHLVVINLTDKRLLLPSDEADAWPPRVVSGSGITIFIVVVQGKRLLPASKQTMPQTVEVSRDELVTPPEDGPDTTSPVAAGAVG